MSDTPPDEPDSELHGNCTMDPLDEVIIPTDEDPPRSTDVEVISLFSDEEPEDGSVIFRTPNGSKRWVPVVREEEKPCIGMLFESIPSAHDFYKKYAHSGRFDTKAGSDKRLRDGSIVRKYINCNKEGKNPKSVLDTVKDGKSSRVRVAPSIKSGCMARITLKRKGAGGFEISQFIECHNHPMATENGVQFLKSRRQLNYVHKKVLVDLSKINVGPVRAFNVYKALCGGYSNVGATPRDFVNFQRNIYSLIGDCDAQMLIDKFNNKQEMCPSFYFEYSVKEGALYRIFWADAVSRRNYSAFGDVMSFDATYKLNKYKMIFVPFTGVDNHRKSVTFAAALISKEDKEGYKWVLESFLRCMGRKPTMVITDQDPALRQVFPVVMSGVRHRFCLWHIMNKMSDKVRFESPLAQEFRQKLSKIIYSEELEVNEFEAAWLEIVGKYGYNGNVWLSNMYKLRRFWIPAYFHDIPLGGLLRTTSLSESQNSFYGRFLSVRMNLLAFVSGFESALENQRHTQAMAEHDSLLRKPQTLTPLGIEVDARDLYTIRVFLDVQKEIVSSGFDVVVVNVTVVDRVKVFELKDSQSTLKNYIVKQDQLNNDFICSCKLFKRLGYHCRHVFFAMRSSSIDKIPRKYVLNRWTKNAVRVADVQGNHGKPVTQPSALIWTEFQRCLALVADDSSKLERLTTTMKELRIQFETEAVKPSVVDQNAIICSLLGVAVPQQVTIKPPVYVHTKGSGKRFISEREKAITKAKKGLKACGNCKKKGTHNKRTCPMPVVNVTTEMEGVVDEDVEI